MAMTSYHLENTDGYWSLKLQAAWHEQPSTEIETAGGELVRRLRDIRPVHLAVDLSDLTYINSATLALIVRIWKALQSWDGRMVVINQHEGIHDILRVASLDTIWTIVADHQTAREVLGVFRFRGWRLGLRIALSVSGVLATLTALGGLGLLLGRPGAVDERTAMVAVCGSMTWGILAGLASVIWDLGSRRYLGIAVLGISLLVAITGGVIRGDAMASVLGIGSQAGQDPLEEAVERGVQRPVE